MVRAMDPHSVSPEDLYNEVINNGGFTFNPTHGFPTSGYAVSCHKDREMSGPREGFHPEIILLYVLSNIDILANDDEFLGGWLDRSTDRVYLDIVRVLHDREEALRLAREHDQICVFDLAAGAEIAAKGAA